MDDLARQLAIRDRMRKRLAAQETPAQRMAAMAELQRRTWAILRASPNGYAHFMRRNFKARAIRVDPKWQEPNAS